MPDKSNYTGTITSGNNTIHCYQHIELEDSEGFVISLPWHLLFDIVKDWDKKTFVPPNHYTFHPET